VATTRILYTRLNPNAVKGPSPSAPPVTPPPPVDPPPDTPPPTVPGPLTVSTPRLPFDMPTDAELDAIDDQVYAPHAMANWTRTLADVNLDTATTAYEIKYWMPPGGVEQAGTTNEVDHRPYGGFMRNRPMGRAPVGAGFTVADKRWEIQQMKAAGFGHLIIDVLGGGANWTRVMEWIQAAYLEGWRNRVILMLDAGGGLVKSGAVACANSLKAAYTSPYSAALRKHTNGKWLLASYAPETAVSNVKTAETDAQVITFWRTWADQMSTNGTPAVLWCCFTRSWRDPTEHTSTCFDDPQLADVVVGLGRWGGTRNPVEAASTAVDNGGAAAFAQSTYQLPYMYTVGVEDNRPDQSKFEEAGGWENMLAWTAQAEKTRPGIVQVATWNDWREGAAIAPSMMHRFATLDALSYFVVKYRFAKKYPGWKPPIVRDALYLAHRAHNTPTVTPQPTYTAGAAYTKRQVKVGSTPERNLIDVLVFAKAACDISVSVAGAAKTVTLPIQPGVAAASSGPSVSVEAGIWRVTAPMSNGTVSATLSRGGAVVGTVTSPKAINLNTQLVQDMMYWRTSSLR
jgi:hypothetical protein